VLGFDGFGRATVLVSGAEDARTYAEAMADALERRSRPPAASSRLEAESDALGRLGLDGDTFWVVAEHGRGAKDPTFGGEQAGEVAHQFPGDVEHGSIGDHVEPSRRPVPSQEPVYRWLHACIQHRPN
jgi:hypothetical protein